MTIEEDETKYRVTYVCKCAADYAVGYGPTPEQAEESVKRFWRRGGHKQSDICLRSVEHAVVHNDKGGSHYEEMP